MSVAILDRLAAVIDERGRERPAGSYVVTLIDGGLEKQAEKLREECEELIEAAAGTDRGDQVHEAADLLFHLWVLLGAQGIPQDEIYAELDRRFGTGGHEEKAARGGAS